MQDIADSLDISKNAVSLAISGKPGISEGLREKVLATASRLGYFQTANKKIRNNNLLLIIDDGRDADIEFFFPIISKTIRYAKEKGYNVLLSSVSKEFQDKHVIPKIYYEMEAEGVLFIGKILEGFLQTFLDMSIPSVLMVQHLYGVAIDNVTSANDDGGYVMTKHLIELGHRKIGFIAEVDMFESFYKRQFGCHRALEEAGIPIGRYDYCYFTAGEKQPDTVLIRTIEKILDLADQPTGWVCGNDHMAIILINEFRKRGIRVPQDVSVVGFDANSPNSIFQPALTTYDACKDLIAKYSVDRILSHIENSNENWDPVTIQVIGKLVEGESARRIN